MVELDFADAYFSFSEFHWDDLHVIEILVISVSDR